MMMSLRTYNCRQGYDALSDGHQYGPAAVLPEVKRSKITKIFRCDHDNIKNIKDHKDAIMIRYIY